MQRISSFLALSHEYRPLALSGFLSNNLDTIGHSEGWRPIGVLISGPHSSLACTHHYRHQPIVTVEENMTNESLAKVFILLCRGGASHKNPSPDQMQ
jgi:hypothetical protein